MSDIGGSTSTTGGVGPTAGASQLRLVPPDAEDQARPDPGHISKLTRWMRSRNIAEELDDTLLSAIGQKVVREHQIDVNSRKEWMAKSEAAMKLAMQITTKKQYPWPGAANIIYPLMTNAAMQFAARAYPAIVADRNVVRGVVVGRDDGTPEMGPMGPKVDPQTGQAVWHIAPGEKRRRAKSIGDHMSWQLLEEMTEWEPQTDQLLHILPIVGCVFRKTYFDPGKARNVSLMVLAQNLVINYWARDIETAPRITEELRLYPLEIRERELGGLFLEQDYGPPNPPPGQEGGGAGDDDAPHLFLEQHRYLDLDEDEYPEPYIVTVHTDTQKVVRITARYDEEGVKFRANKVGKIDPIQYYTQYNFLPSLDGGLYGTGFGQLLSPLNDAVNTTTNLLIDAGHLSVVGGGFVGKSLSLSAGTMRFSPGEFKTAGTTGGNLRDNVYQLQFPPPSDVLFKLLTLLIDAGDKVGAIKDILTGEQSGNNVPATTTLALIEQGLKVFTGIYKRVYRSLKSELDKLYRLNRVYMDYQADYKIGEDWRIITQGDYERGAGVAPVSDPTMVTDMQLAARAQFLLTFKDDQRCNGIAIMRRAFDAVKIDNPEELFNKGPMMPAPELIILAKEADIKAERVHAQRVLDLARAVHALARASMETDDARVDLLQQKADMLMEQLEANPSGGGATEGGLTGQMQGSQQAQQQAPPMSGARQAPDGHWYIPDPSRANKYLRIRQNGTGV